MSPPLFFLTWPDELARGQMICIIDQFPGKIRSTAPCGMFCLDVYTYSPCFVLIGNRKEKLAALVDSCFLNLVHHMFCTDSVNFSASHPNHGAHHSLAFLLSHRIYHRFFHAYTLHSRLFPFSNPKYDTETLTVTWGGITPNRGLWALEPQTIQHRY